MACFKFNISEKDITHRLAIAKKASINNPYPEISYHRDVFNEEPRCAAVLIPLLWADDSWHILFTRRNQSLPEHSGQVAFPGGRCDPEDKNPESTALREAHEEIGLNPETVRILGCLNDFLTVTNYRVTPVVGVMPWPYPLHLAEVEVSRAFTIPLAWLSDPQNHEIRRRQLPAPYSTISVVYFNEYDNEILWGASARFTLRLIEVLFPK